MKVLNLSLLFLIFTLLSCSSTMQFPVSDVVPAAHIKAKISDGDHENTKIKITADHLANPNRLSPSKSLYVVWIVTENDLIRASSESQNLKL